MSRWRRKVEIKENSHSSVSRLGVEVSQGVPKCHRLQFDSGHPGNVRQRKFYQFGVPLPKQREHGTYSRYQSNTLLVTRWIVSCSFPHREHECGLCLECYLNLYQVLVLTNAYTTPTDGGSVI